MISQYFTLSELTKSDTAIRLGIYNEPNLAQVANLQLLVSNVLDPCREHFGPIRVTSGYRSPELCLAVGSSINSQHAKGQAADIECLSPAVSNVMLAEYIANTLDFDQLILEFYIPGDPKSGWVHVSYSQSKNRKELLLANRVNGSTTYTKVTNFNNV